MTAERTLLVAVALSAAATVVAQTSSQPPAKDAGLEAKAQACVACHGPNGNSVDPQ